MKLTSLFIYALSSISVNAISQTSDIYYHERPLLGANMWQLSADGLTIFSPKGDVVKTHRKESICVPYMGWSGTLNEDCSYFTVKSDGHKFVWAASMSSPPRIDVFDIDTGEYAGYQLTCSTPLDLTYHPSRDEMWLRCAQKAGEDHTGEIDVFSSGSLSSDHELIHLNGTSRPYGRLTLHSSMGPYAYASSYNMNYLSELDLSSKSVSNEYVIPKSYGAYDMAYSPENEHIFMRTRVCCTCGEKSGADIASCGRYAPPDGEPVMVQSGPSASLNLQNGTCGRSCLGSPADTIGVAEFDTVSKQFVGEHTIKEGTGFGSQPYGSPDGKYILLLPNDGGKYVRVLSPGKNGEASKFLKDIFVDFQGGQGYEPGQVGDIVVSDAAFINDQGRNILVLASSEDNNIALVDINDNFRMRKLNVAPTSSESTEKGSSRSIEWAINTNYVWISGAEAEQQYVIEIPSGIDSARWIKTLPSPSGSHLIFVNNYERVRAVELMSAMIDGAVTGLDIAKAGVTTNLMMETVETSDNGSSVGTAGLVVGCVALVVGFGAIFLAKSKPNSIDLSFGGNKDAV